MIDNINNLFRFYREVGACPSVLYTNALQYSVVNGAENSWPQLVFDIDFQGNAAHQLDQVLKETVKRKLPAFAVCNAELFGEKELEYLRQNEIYPVKIWTLMYALPQNFPVRKMAKKSENIEIRELKTAFEIDAFSALVNAELLETTRISATLANELNAKENCKLFGLFVSGKMVSCLSTFADSKTTGLYFIVTDSAFRGQGFAAALISEVMYSCQKNSELLVLQSVQKAVPLYQRLGFTTEGKMVIFWKKGKI
ncbi:MAG: GNAT family N-acetyltransferase [Bacteroidales bacterium]|nr:GNAT family N-acetyltransferase [Bacteroidales bacterium]